MTTTYRFNPDADVITGDFETRSFSDLKRQGAHKYSLHPSTQVLCLNWKINDEPVELWHRAHPIFGIAESPQPDRLIAAIEAGCVFEAHNAMFEKKVAANSFRREFPWFPELDQDRVRCTAARAATHNLPRGLDGATALLGLPGKDKEGHEIMLQLCRPETPAERLARLRHDPGSNARMEPVDFPGWEEQCGPFFAEYRQLREKAAKRFKNPNLPEDDCACWYWPGDADMHRRNWAYGGQDTDAERGLGLRLQPIPARQMTWWFLDQEINNRGVAIDANGVHGAIRIADEADRRANLRLGELTGEEITKASQGKRILKLVNERCGEGTLSDLQRGTVEEALREEKIEDDLSLKVLKIRLDVGRATPRKFRAMLNGLADDRRLRDIVIYEGSHTGRWAGVNAQLLNLFRGIGDEEEMHAIWRTIASGDLDWLEHLYGLPAMTCLTRAARGAIVAGEGTRFLDADFKTIQVRLALWLGGETETLKLMEQGHDVYRIMAAEDIFHVPLERVTTYQRQVAKSALLGCQFGLGPPGFVVYCANLGIDIPFSGAMSAVSGYRERFPGVVECWDRLEVCAIKATAHPGKVFGYAGVKFKRAGRFLFMKLPSGRIVHYPDPAIRKHPKFEGQLQLTYRGFGGARIGTWGGKIFADVVQSLEVDVVAPAAVRLQERLPLDVCLIVHDETLNETRDPGLTLDDVFEVMMERDDIPWADGVPIQCEGWEGYRYKWK